MTQKRAQRNAAGAEQRMREAANRIHLESKCVGREIMNEKLRDEHLIDSRVIERRVGRLDERRNLVFKVKKLEQNEKRRFCGAAGRNRALKTGGGCTQPLQAHNNVNVAWPLLGGRRKFAAVRERRVKRHAARDCA